MLLYTKTRNASRNIVSRRKAAGLPAKVIDFGKDAPARRRYAVDLHNVVK